MTETTRVHAGDWQAKQFHPDGNVPWREATPPDIQTGQTTGRMRSCQFCGSMHPSDVAAAIRAGARGSFADCKYGWPHKAYFDGVPYQFAGMLESRHSKSHPTQEEKDSGAFIEVPSYGFDQHTGKPNTQWVEAGKPAAATTHGKFYTIHLQDATPEDRDTIERHLGLRFEFDGTGVGWKSVSLDPAPAADAHPAVAAMQPLDNDGKALDLNDDTPLAPACDLSADGACESCQ